MQAGLILPEPVHSLHEFTLLHTTAVVDAVLLQDYLHLLHVELAYLRLVTDVLQSADL